jgi:dihydropteroate synthase
MDIFTGEAAGQRDLETIALSLGLAKDVDILRVHSPIEHQRALLASGHLNNQFKSAAN